MSRQGAKTQRTRGRPSTRNFFAAWRLGVRLGDLTARPARDLEKKTTDYSDNHGFFALGRSREMGEREEE
jgi:hypothetical protein